jgi:hypothetical protein
LTVRVIAGSETANKDVVQEIIKILAFQCLTIEEANRTILEVKRQLESISVMNAYEMLYRDNLPK